MPGRPPCIITSCWATIHRSHRQPASPEPQLSEEVLPRTVPQTWKGAASTAQTATSSPVQRYFGQRCTAFPHTSHTRTRHAALTCPLGGVVFVFVWSPPPSKGVLPCRESEATVIGPSAFLAAASRTPRSSSNTQFFLSTLFFLLLLPSFLRTPLFSLSFFPASLPLLALDPRPPLLLSPPPVFCPVSSSPPSRPPPPLPPPVRSIHNGKVH